MVDTKNPKPYPVLTLRALEIRSPVFLSKKSHAGLLFLELCNIPLEASVAASSGHEVFSDKSGFMLSSLGP